MRVTPFGRAARKKLPAISSLIVALVALPACRTQPAPETSASDGRPTPVYDEATGKLKELVSDRDQDGKPDVRAFMDGAQLQRIEIDRDRDGRPDRWEYYDPTGTGAISTPTPGRQTIVRAEESSRADGAITRWEHYQAGVIDRVEEDTDNDGRVDKWEYYADGVVARLELDLAGRGKPDRRLVYGANGNVDRIEQDTDGDGTFEPVQPPGAGRSADSGTAR